MRLIAVIAGVLAAASVWAEEPAPKTPWNLVESDSLIASAGAFEPQSGQANGRHGLALGLAWERRLRSGLRFGIEVNYYTVDMQTPQGISCGSFCVVDSTMGLDVMGVGPRVGFGKRFGNTDLYAGAGAGLYFSKMTATGSTLGLPGEHDEKDNQLGADLRAGVSFSYGDHKFLGVEARRLSVSANFGVLSNNQDIPIGGTFLLINWGFL